MTILMIPTRLISVSRIVHYTTLGICSKTFQIDPMNILTFPAKLSCTNQESIPIFTITEPDICFLVEDPNGSNKCFDASYKTYLNKKCIHNRIHSSLYLAWYRVYAFSCSIPFLSILVDAQNRSNECFGASCKACLIKENIILLVYPQTYPFFTVPSRVPGKCFLVDAPNRSYEYFDPF